MEYLPFLDPWNRGGRKKDFKVLVLILKKRSDIVRNCHFDALEADGGRGTTFKEKFREIVAADYYSANTRLAASKTMAVVKV